MGLLSVGGESVIVHYDDVPSSDLTTFKGIPCTTALRTVIDVACEVEPHDLAVMVRDCLDRQLFTVEEAYRRLGQPDMVDRRGAHRLRSVLLAQGDET